MEEMLSGVGGVNVLHEPHNIVARWGGFSLDI